VLYKGEGREAGRSATVRTVTGDVARSTIVQVEIVSDAVSSFLSRKGAARLTNG